MHVYCLHNAMPKIQFMIRTTNVEMNNSKHFIAIAFYLVLGHILHKLLTIPISD